jgi:short-subunit dehydrogenase
MRIRGSVAVVTGASSGIGRATALALARRGAAVALIARGERALEEVAGEIGAAGGKALVVPCDVADPDAVESAAAAIVRALGIPSLLINCAGLGIWRPFAAISPAEHRRMMDVNYWGTFHWIAALLPAMRERRSGAIVNVVAGSAKLALPVTSGFAAAKAAVAALGESLRRELAGSGVAVTSLFPGSVRTGFWSDERIDAAEIPPLVRWAPKLSANAVARHIVLAARLGLAQRTLPFFLAFASRADALWPRLGDLLLWRWFVPATAGLLTLRYLLG